MLANMSSGAVAAKAHTLYRYRLTAEDYTQLSSKRNLSEVVGYLKADTAYTDLLQNVQETGVHRHQLEFLLHKSYFRTYEKLRRFISGPDGGFFDYPGRLAELQMLLSAIEYVTAPTHTDFVSGLPLYLDHHLPFDVAALGRVSSYGDILHVMRGTPFYDTLKRYEPPAGLRLDFVSCEFALRREYYDWLFGAVKKLPRTARGDVEELFQRQVELINISNIYRMKRFYGMPPGRIAELVFPHYGNMGEKQLRALVEAPDMDTFWEMLDRSPYGEAFASSDHGFIENTTHRIRDFYSRRAFRRRHDAAAVFATYLFLLETEIENIITIAEGVSFGLEPAEIARLLII